MIEKDKEVQDKDRELRGELAIYKNMMKGMENKLTAYRKTVKSLTEQLDTKVYKYCNCNGLFFLIYQPFFKAINIFQYR